MTTTQLIAKHLRDVYFGVNWTWSNYKDVLADVTWQQATTQVHGLNTIATLVFHTHYFVGVAAIPVLQGGPLNAKDKYSWNHPPIESEEDWQKMLDQMFTDAETLAGLIEQLPDDILDKTFVEEKYGNYFRNLNGIIEHCHYHLGQIAIIKKIVAAEASE